MCRTAPDALAIVAVLNDQAWSCEGKSIDSYLRVGWGSAIFHCMMCISCRRAIALIEAGLKAMACQMRATD
jgi:hypothetical protein